MLGGGCQVRVIIKNMMGRMENLRTLISGFLGFPTSRKRLLINITATLLEETSHM